MGQPYATYRFEINNATHASQQTYNPALWEETGRCFFYLLFVDSSVFDSFNSRIVVVALSIDTHFPYSGDVF